MKNILSILFILAILVQTISCGKHDLYGDDHEGDAIGGSSSSNRGSAGYSSGGGSQQGVVYGEPVVYGGETYQTVVIGHHTWMARNLNIPHNEGNGNSWCYDDDESNCEKYGRLYDWAAAMDLPARYNNGSYDNTDLEQIKPKYRGLCPPGFHIPREGEWKLLEYFTEGRDYDAYGFSPLPGGYRAPYEFAKAGSQGAWWGADNFSEDFKEDISLAYNYLMHSDSGTMLPFNHRSYNPSNLRCYASGRSSEYCPKYYGFSVRCVSDDVKAIYGEPVVYGGETYQTVMIGPQTWMARNLNIPHNEGRGNSWCYGEDHSDYKGFGTDYSADYKYVQTNCDKYGRLYDRSAAMDIPSKCNDNLNYASDPDCAISSPHRGLCPEGFHVPSINDVVMLETYASGWVAGTVLKASNGWENPYGDDSEWWNANRWWADLTGTDDFGFAALPGSYLRRSCQGCAFAYPYRTGWEARWWLNDDSYHCKEEHGHCVDNFYTSFDYPGIAYIGWPYTFGLSVRCIKD